MNENQCPHCGHVLVTGAGASFCQFCGGALVKAQPAPMDAALQKFLQQAESESDPKKKHEILTRAQAAYPDSLAVAEELLYMGRLYERSARQLDFSVIKSYLLNLYLEPDAITPAKQAEMRRELFDYADLERCLALCEDRATFMHHYLKRLSSDFISLFLQGSSQYMHRWFGISVDSRAPKLLAIPAAKMIAAMTADEQLTAEQRGQLVSAFYAAFAVQYNGETSWLQKELAERNITIA